MYYSPSIQNERKMKRPHWFIQATILCYFLSLMTACQSNNSVLNETIKTPPNILFILTDDQGWGDLSINGNQNLHTPNIDQLAKNGAILDRFYVSPVCSPTRAEILTGRYAVRSGVYSTSQGGERIDLDETIIAEIFQQAGYKTGAFGKWHSGMQYPYHPNGRGFEAYYGFCSGHWGNYIDPMLEYNGELVQGKGFLPDDLTNKTMDFIEKNKAQPFFAYLPFNTPHSPMQMPDEWWNKFKDKELAFLGDGRSKEATEHTKAALAFCENIDWNVGRLVKKLQALGLEENTIIIYLSDNGPNGARWNGNMKGRKGSTDEGGVRSPTFIQWKNKIPAGTKIGTIAAAIDFLPTLTDLAGIQMKTNKPVDGKSIKSLLLDKNAVWEDRFIYNYWREKLSVRSQNFRLGHDEQLFDMIKDPEQRVNVAKQFPKIYEELKTAHTNWLNMVAVELPKEDTRSFPIGHPAYQNTQIPARDGLAHGNIKRSNRWPNCSFFKNWVDTDDKITWEVEVMESGTFDVVVYYTCAKEDIGGTFELRFGENALQEKIIEAHNPPLKNVAQYRFPNGESFVKDFKPLNIGQIHLEKGKGILSLNALTIPGKELMDFRLMMLKRI